MTPWARAQRCGSPQQAWGAVRVPAAVGGGSNDAEEKGSTQFGRSLEQRLRILQFILECCAPDTHPGPDHHPSKVKCLNSPHARGNFRNGWRGGQGWPGLASFQEGLCGEGAEQSFAQLQTCLGKWIDIGLSLLSIHSTATQKARFLGNKVSLKNPSSPVPHYVGHKSQREEEAPTGGLRVMAASVAASGAKEEEPRPQSWLSGLPS